MQVRPRSALVVALVAVCVSAAACGGRQEAEGGDTSSCTAGSGAMALATGNSTGTYYVLGGGLAKVWSDETDLNVTASETGASVQNIEQLVDGDFDVAFSLADSAEDAVNGTASFSEPQPIEALARLYPNATHVVVNADSGIDSVADMAGKAISTGSPKSGTEVIARRLITAAGLQVSDVDTQRLDTEQTVSAMKDGSIDGFFFSAGAPTSAVTDVVTSMGDDVEFLDVTDLLPEMQQLSSLYYEGTLPAKAYDLDQDVPVIMTPNVLLVNEDFDEGNACALTKLLFESQDQLVKVHPSAAQLSLEQADKTEPIPMSSGAQQAIDELRTQ